jgi:hypothetical protein
MENIMNMTSRELIPLLYASLWPSGLSWWSWGIIIIVGYMINVFISARFLLPVGLPDSSKGRRIRNAFLLAVILSWPMAYLIILMLSEIGRAPNVMGLLGSMFGWIFFVALDFIANWKIFETYFPLRQNLGGSEAYANLHRHMWGHLVALAGLVLALLGAFIWHVVR